VSATLLAGTVNIFVRTNVLTVTDRNKMVQNKSVPLPWRTNAEVQSDRFQPTTLPFN